LKLNWLKDKHESVPTYDDACKTIFDMKPTMNGMKECQTETKEIMNRVNENTIKMNVHLEGIEKALVHNGDKLVELIRATNGKH